MLGDRAYCVGVPFAPCAMAVEDEFLPTSSVGVGCKERGHKGAVQKLSLADCGT